MREFYQRFLAKRLVTIPDAGKEPLTIDELHRSTAYSGMSRDDKPITLGEAICYCCIENLVSKFNRREKPTINDIYDIVAQMIFSYKHWTVLDLPTFVNQCVAGRVQAYVSGVMTGEMGVLDVPNILRKLDAYDRMRPSSQKVATMSPLVETLQPIKEEHYHCLIDGTPYDFKVPYDDFVHGYVTPSGDPRRNAELYWRSRPNFDVDYADQCFDAKANYRQPIVKTVNETLGIK